MDIYEPDWRHLRSLRPLALDRFCTRVLDECATVIADASLTSHQRYLRLFELVQERDQVLARVFDHPRRSTALLALLQMARLELLTPAELAGFSEGTRERLRMVLDEPPPAPATLDSGNR